MVHVDTFERLNNIPSKDDIKDVLNNYVSGLMTELIVHNKIRGAIVYGSVPRDEHSETSDLDVLVRYISTDVLPRLRDTKIKALKEEIRCLDSRKIDPMLVSQQGQDWWADFNSTMKVINNECEKIV